jgi:hypothetical protein
MSTLLTTQSLMFFALGIVSMVTHSIKKWASGEISGNPFDWYIDNPRATVGALLICLSGVATAIFSGVLIDPNVPAQLVAGWGIGYASDTINNQGAKS